MPNGIHTNAMPIEMLNALPVQSNKARITFFIPFNFLIQNMHPVLLSPILSASRTALLSHGNYRRAIAYIEAPHLSRSKLTS